MKKNCAAYFSAPNKVETIERPIVRPGAGQVLIESSRSLISPGTEISMLSQRGVYKGSVWESAWDGSPAVPGYMNVGTVIETGKDIDKKWLGRKVVSCTNHSAYNTADFAQAALKPVRDGITDETAVFSVFAEIALNGVRRARLTLGETVVVYGLGIIGNLAVQLARIGGASKVIAVDTSDFRLGVLPAAPDVIKVNPLKQDVKDAVSGATKGRMADVVFEVTGVASLIPKELEILRKQGKFIVLSSPRGKTELDFHDLCNAPSFEIIGAHNMSHPAVATLDNQWTCGRDVELFQDLAADGRIDAVRMITHRVKYTDAPKMYDMLLKGADGVLGVVFEW